MRRHLLNSLNLSDRRRAGGGLPLPWRVSISRVR